MAHTLSPSPPLSPEIYLGRPVSIISIKNKKIKARLRVKPENQALKSPFSRTSITPPTALPNPSHDAVQPPPPAALRSSPPVRFSLFAVPLVLVISAVYNWFSASLRPVFGPSMLPTINLTGDVVLVDRVSLQQGKISCGDVVMVRSPENPIKVVTKRLVAMEGDTVTFIADPNNSDISKSVVVPKGHIWVQGDNIYDSRDSRHFGAVPYALLYGRICWRIWPPKDFGPIPTTS